MLVGYQYRCTRDSGGLPVQVYTVLVGYLYRCTQCWWATCTGVVQVYTECWWMTLGPANNAAGPTVQPIFQPVTEKVLPAEPIVMVRSHIPGRVAVGKYQ